MLLTLFFASPVLADDGGRPIDWVETEAWDTSWMAATARVRESLDEFDADDPELRRWVPAVKHRASHLHDVPGDNLRF